MTEDHICKGINDFSNRHHDADGTNGYADLIRIEVSKLTDNIAHQ